MYNQKAYELGANGSCIRELYAYGRQRAALIGDENVFDFTQGNPSNPTPKKVEETVQSLMADMNPLELHGYTSAVGDPAARQAIADDLNARFDAGASADELFLCCGTTPALAAVFGALTVPGAQIVALAPFFPEYRPLAEGAGASFVVVPPDIPDFQIPMGALEAALTEHTVAVIVNSPNNPAGTVYTEKTLRALAQLLEEKSRQYGHPIYIVADEPYRELTYDGVQTPFIPNIYPNTVVCYSYSKSLTLAGERIGYVYVPKQAQDSKALYAAVSGTARAIGHICAPSLWQKVIARCAHLRPDMTAYDKNRRALYEGLTAAGYEVAKPQGAFYLFVKAPDGDAMAFAERAKNMDIILVPGNDFGCSAYCRLCYCVSYEKLQRSLPRFRELIESYR
ncbi:MAG: pyridoxal phosphate-dependent aminotransferase [Oscillospiraceae bacterium]|nr:pyridoxal phosphate-dependent aminotransferase [Oscillospiraceae bacterium]